MVKSFFQLTIICILLNGCLSVHRGYKFEENDEIDIKTAVEKKLTMTEIIDKFGSPSFINHPMNDIICYIDAEGKRVSFNRFFKPNYQFMCIFFENQVAKELKQMSLTRIKKTKMTKYNTSFKKPI